MPTACLELRLETELEDRGVQEGHRPPPPTPPRDIHNASAQVLSKL